MRWEVRNSYRNLVGKCQGNHVEDLGVDGKIILKWILNKYSVVLWTALNWRSIGSNAELL
jgi:hypothetical protein